MNSHDRAARIVFAGKSDVGLKRANNEDALVLKPELDLFAVADGMGGAAGGEIASRVFTEAASDVFSKERQDSEEAALEMVQRVFLLANERILSLTSETPQLQGMGCTAELVAFYNRGYVIGHVGDSRTYLFREGQLRQLTRDHSLIQDQIDQGLISAEDARKHSLRHVILRAVGVSETLAVDLIRGKGRPGDQLLLCSDGLTDMVEDPAIEQVLSISGGLSERVERLIDLAKTAGGHDNITVILCEVLS